jgi:hypothetical protein
LFDGRSDCNADPTAEKTSVIHTATNKDQAIHALLKVLPSHSGHTKVADHASMKAQAKRIETKSE